MRRRGKGAALVAGVVVQRLAELFLSRRNTRRTLERGGVESGRRHFGGLFVLHAAFLASCLLEPKAPLDNRIRATALAAFAGAQALRYWAIASLGERWSVRVVTLPETQPVTHGPYRYIRHPNYLAVAIESVALPLALGAPRTAAVFFPLHLLGLASRIRIEERALGEHWRSRFEQTPRFIPHVTVPG